MKPGPSSKKILLLTLKTFSATGGIEKVCRIAAKALSEITSEARGRLHVYSMYDQQADAGGQPYFPSENFRGFGQSRLSFMLSAIRKGWASDVVLLSHVNLLSAGWIIRLFRPSVKLILIAHGIEVWRPMSAFQKKMLMSCTQVLAVSNYTKDQLQLVHHYPSEKCVVLNNCLDPFLPPPATSKDAILSKQYNLKEDEVVLLTLTRLAGSERHKGYDKVITAIAEIEQKSSAKFHYLLAGKYTESEKKHIEQLAISTGLTSRVTLTGFVPESAMAEVFGLADIYIMPSKKEGFGIVFIEALYYGLPVIAGNKDGSVDALGNGAFGITVDPDDQEAITNALQEIAVNTRSYMPDTAEVNKRFGFDTYREGLKKILQSLYN